MRELSLLKEETAKDFNYGQVTLATLKTKSVGNSEKYSNIAKLFGARDWGLQQDLSILRNCFGQSELRKRLAELELARRIITKQLKEH